MPAGGAQVWSLLSPGDSDGAGLINAAVPLSEEPSEAVETEYFRRKSVGIILHGSHALILPRLFSEGEVF